jgi:hypothetical protein
MPIAAVPIDASLYKKVLSEAKRTFKVWPSAYASGWVVHEYKKRGGRYKTLKSKRHSHSHSKSISHTHSKSISRSKSKHKSHSKSKHRSDSRPLRRWFDEVWIDVCHLPKLVPCGRQNLSYDTYENNYPYCRPLKRITSNTPRTARELSRSEIKSRCRRKRKNPHKRVL